MPSSENYAYRMCSTAFKPMVASRSTSLHHFIIHLLHTLQVCLALLLRNEGRLECILNQLKDAFGRQAQRLCHSQVVCVDVPAEVCWIIAAPTNIWGVLGQW